MVDINTTLKELGQAFAGLSERFSGMEILGKLKKEKIKMANRITQKKLSRAVIQDLFGFEDIHKLQHIGISEAWRHSLKETDFTLKYTEDDRFYPLQALSERETENYLQRYHEKFWDEEDGWVDRDLVEHLDMFFDNFSEELGGESRREFNGGIGVVSAGDLEHYEYTFHNAQECSQEVYFKPWGQISMSDMLREGGSPNPIWDKGNRFNRIPNALKGLLLVEAMQFWTNGNFMVGRTQKSDFNLYTDRVIWSTEKARKIAEFMRKLVDPLCEKLPRALIAAIKNLNPIAMADMNGLVSFKLHESDMTFYVYETGIDQIQDRKRYSFYAIPATYIDRTNTEEERREIFMSRLRAWKIIADFMMDCVVSPLSAEEIELREGQKELQALIEEYLKPKYVIGGPKDE